MDRTLNSNSSLVSSNSDFVEIATAPYDKYNYSYWSFLMLGVVLILPWNALVQSLGYLDGKYPEKDFNFLVSTLANAPIFFSQILVLLFYRFIDLKKFIIASLFIMALLSVGIPLVTNYWNEYIAIMTILSLFWFFNGILQSASFGYAGPFPPRIVSALTNGWGLSGVIIGGWRAISLAVFPTKNNDENDPNLFNGAILYFSFASFCCILWLILFTVMIRTKYNLHYVQVHQWNTERSNMNSIDSVNNKITRNTIDTDMYR